MLLPVTLEAILVYYVNSVKYLCILCSFCSYVTHVRKFLPFKILSSLKKYKIVLQALFLGVSFYFTFSEWIENIFCKFSYCTVHLEPLLLSSVSMSAESVSSLLNECGLQLIQCGMREGENLKVFHSPIHYTCIWDWPLAKIFTWPPPSHLHFAFQICTDGINMMDPTMVDFIP
jgi:hypothetical protein